VVFDADVKGGHICPQTEKRIDDGGAAFPGSGDYSGMTLRQWYAGMAMQGAMVGVTISEEAPEQQIKVVAEEVARRIFIFADAMIEEGKK
jgi:hypothetical protein